MKTAITLRQRLKGKKRYIALGIIAVELASLPAAAKIIHMAAFQTKPRVLAAEIKTSEPGVSRFLVNSNDGFGVEIEGFIGEVKTTVYESGTLASKRRFGDEAQLPGAAKSCAQSLSNQANPVYQAVRKTELGDAHVVDQAVVFEFRYKAQVKPNFKFTPGKAKVDALKACEI